MAFGTFIFLKCKVIYISSGAGVIGVGSPGYGAMVVLRSSEESGNTSHRGPSVWPDMLISVGVKFKRTDPGHVQDYTIPPSLSTCSKAQ